MPVINPSKKFLDDIEVFRFNKIMKKKIAKALNLLAQNPLHPGLNLERILNDPAAWSIRVDRRYRISFDIKGILPSGSPDWSDIILLRILDHDDLYKRPR